MPNSRTTQWGAAVRPLNDYEVANYYTIANIFSKNSSSPAYGYDWTPPAVITSVEQDNTTKQIPTSYELFQNYPNPFNPTTQIEYQITSAGHVEVQVFNINGELIKTLTNAELSAGKYSVCWNGKDKNNNSVASGIYIYRVMSGNSILSKKMLLLK